MGGGAFLRYRGECFCYCVSLLSWGVFSLLRFFVIVGSVFLCYRGECFVIVFLCYRGEWFRYCVSFPRSLSEKGGRLLACREVPALLLRVQKRRLCYVGCSLPLGPNACVAGVQSVAIIGCAGYLRRRCFPKLIVQPA